MKNDLTQKRCLPCEGLAEPLSRDAINEHLKTLVAWRINDDFTEIRRKFDFKDYYHTMAFVNAIAWIAHHENHHPDLDVSYNACIVRYSTHALKGLSDNDFICAAKVDSMFNI